MTNTQKLKAVAELLGYDALSFISFDPRKNPAQLIEVEDLLLRRGWDLFWQYGTSEYCWRKVPVGSATDAVRATAAINAAAEIAEDK